MKLIQRLKWRLKCWWHGCQVDGEGYQYECWRCGAELYDADFVQLSFWRRTIPENWVALWWKFRMRITNKCGNCGKHLWLQPYGFCNEKCEKDWIPF